MVAAQLCDVDARGFLFVLLQEVGQYVFSLLLLLAFESAQDGFYLTLRLCRRDMFYPAFLDLLVLRGENLDLVAAL